jgi:hypothetical protein
MRISDLGRYALCICAAMVILAGCGASQSPIGAPGAMPQSANAVRPDHGRSWMAPDAKKKDLLYVSDVGTDDVYVYSYPKGTLKGTLTGFTNPVGECVDKTGDVFITDFFSSNILEFAHGGTSPIATLSDPGYYPTGCSVDPTTGNLAVTNEETAVGSGQGDVAIYKDAKGSPKAHYADPHIYYMYFCGYDNAGNLFVDGQTSDSAFGFGKLPSGGSSFTNITLNQSIAYPGGVQWDGKNTAVGDEQTGVIYEFTIKRKKGTKVGSTPLVGASAVYQFWIQGAKVVAPSEDTQSVMIYNYPAGGSATKTITGLDSPAGATVSRAK